MSSTRTTGTAETLPGRRSPVRRRAACSTNKLLRNSAILLLERWSLLQLLDQSRSTIFRFGGVGCTERTGAILKALQALSREEKIIQSFRSLGTTLWPMPNGRVNGYRLKPSGNSPPAAGWNQSDTAGGTTSSPAA